MIKIDFKTFIHHRYWCGWYYVTTCPNHARYDPNCGWCWQGIWGSSRAFNSPRNEKLKSYFTIGVMTENSLRFVSNDLKSS